MGIGVIGIQTSQKRKQSGAPFAAGSADNGLSVDGVSGQIVLGNDVGDATQPAALVTAREIVTNASGVALDFAIVTNAIRTLLNGNRILITGGDFVTPFLNIVSGQFGASTITLQSGADGQSAMNINTGLNGIATLQVQSNTQSFTITADGQGFITFNAAGIDVWRVNLTTFFTQIGPTLVTSNGATLQVTGALTHRRFLQSQGAGTYNVDRDLDSAKVFRNSAAATFALPNMAGANLRTGFTAGFNCNNVAGLTVTASAGQVIRFGSLVTSSGGTLSTTDVGAFCQITLQDAGTWFTESFNGAWLLT